MSKSITKVTYHELIDGFGSMEEVTLYYVGYNTTDYNTFIARRADGTLETVFSCSDDMHAAMDKAVRTEEELTGPERAEVAAHWEKFAPASDALRALARPASAFLPLGDRIRTQDNRCTADPLYVVFQKKRIYGLDTGYTDNIVWFDEESEASDEQAKELEAQWQEDRKEPGTWHRTGYVDVDVFVTACFTEAGAQAYIAANGHNLKNPHIYVETLYRNAEMIGLREWLNSLGVAAEAAAGPSAVSPPKTAEDAAAVPNAKPNVAPVLEGEAVRGHVRPEDVWPKEGDVFTHRYAPEVFKRGVVVINSGRWSAGNRSFHVQWQDGRITSHFSPTQELVRIHADAAAVPNARAVLGYFKRGPLKWMLTRVNGGLLVGIDISTHGKVQTMHMDVTAVDELVLLDKIRFSEPPDEFPESVEHLIKLSGWAMKMGADDLAENLMDYARHLNGGRDLVPEIAGSGMQR